MSNALIQNDGYKTIRGEHFQEESKVLEVYLKSIPKRFKNLFTRAFFGKLSPMNAIKAKCYDCNGYEDVSKRITDCSIRRCSLWKYRPVFQENKK